MKIKEFLPYLVLFLIALAILHPIFSPGFLTKSDSPVHLAEADYLANHVIKDHFWINGWYPYEYAGIPIQMYYYQIGLLLVAFLSLTGINIILAYKIILIFSLFLPSAAIFHLIKKHFNPGIAVLISAAFLFQKDYSKLLLAGMWANLIAFAVFILLFKKLLDYRFIITKKRALILGLLSAVLILAHPFFGVTLVYTILIAYFFSIKATKNIGKTTLDYIILSITAILVSLFYVYPFFDTSLWLNPGSGWGLGNSLKEMLFNLVGIFLSLKPHLTSFNYLLSLNPLFFKELIKSIIANFPMLFINILAILGLFFFKKEQNRKIKSLLTFTILFTLASLIIGSGFWFLFPFGKTIPFLNGILAYRFVYYARLGLFTFSAYTLYKIQENNNNNLIAWAKEKKKIILSVIILIILVGFFLGLNFPPKEYTQTFNQAEISQETTELWGWLNLNLPKDQFRILNQNFFDNIGEPLVTKDSILPAMAHYYTGLSFFGTWYTTVYPIEQKAQTENSQLFGKKISNITGEELKENLEAYNVKYAIAISPELKSKLESSGLKKAKEFPNYTVYTFQEYQPSWVKTKEPITSKLTEFTDQKMVFELENPSQQKAILKFAYHPYWKASISGKEIPLTMNNYKLMEAELPKGKYSLTLEYQPKKYPTIIISLASLIIVAAILVSNKLFKMKA
ncbi:MAG TPA: hypothetical protein VJH95_01955 [Candidatus Nanoarchaeia archaeon]|nr:hypothetical protein [Candidatus Nanoarchaeia archaeon]